MNKKKSSVIEKMQIAEDLFNFAYSVKSFRLKKLNPTWSAQAIHEKTLSLIEKGCR